MIVVKRNIKNLVAWSVVGDLHSYSLHIETSQLLPEK